MIYAAGMSSMIVHDLRTRVAEVVASQKAYDVPVICTRLGLSSGTEEEAMRSKLRYVNSRLLPLDRPPRRGGAGTCSSRRETSGSPS